MIEVILLVLVQDKVAKRKLQKFLTHEIYTKTGEIQK
jgi:hypothetical protein